MFAVPARARQVQYELSDGREHLEIEGQPDQCGQADLTPSGPEDRGPQELSHIGPTPPPCEQGGGAYFLIHRKFDKPISLVYTLPNLLIEFLLRRGFE